MSKSLVLIADIEASRGMENKERENIQQRLEKNLNKLNEQANDDKGLVSPYTVTLGDEFQAVFNKADHIFIHIIKIMAMLHPVTVRFSLGVGSIATPINKEQAIGMDGPAFHEAREGIHILKESGFLFNIRIEDEDDLTLKIINSSLQLLSKNIRSWNKTRITILYMLKQGYDYKAISKELDISQTAFYKNKEAGLLDVVDEMTDNMAKVINQKLAQ